MNFYATLPLLFLRFYFFDAPKGIIAYFASLNHAFLQLFSLPIVIKTYFKPWKNEYRKDFIAVAIGLGMVIKTFVIIADLFIFFILLAFEILFFLAFIAWPIATVWVLLR